MTNYGLRQNHRKIIGKTKKSAFCVPYSVPILLSRVVVGYLLLIRGIFSRYTELCPLLQFSIYALAAIKGMISTNLTVL
jgi:hypothetical protein